MDGSNELVVSFPSLMMANFNFHMVGPGLRYEKLTKQPQFHSRP
jgi:hypothetical protein